MSPDPDQPSVFLKSIGVFFLLGFAMSDDFNAFVDSGLFGANLVFTFDH